MLPKNQDSIQQGFEHVKYNINAVNNQYRNFSLPHLLLIIKVELFSLVQSHIRTLERTIQKFMLDSHQ